MANSSNKNTGTTRARPRRGRPPKVETEHLLRVAREVFLERGLGATTSEVAERAAVAEGTLFHRFGSKDALFREAMQLSEEDVPQQLLESLERAEGLELSEALTKMAEDFLEIGRIALPLMMMSWSSPGCRLNNQSELRFRAFLKRLASFFELQMERGILRRMDAEVLARTFLGSVHHFNLVRIVSSSAPEPMIPQGMFVRGLVDLLLRGSLAHPPARPEPSRPA